jgi:hypothetical protein
VQPLCSPSPGAAPTFETSIAHRQPNPLPDHSPPRRATPVDGSGDPVHLPSSQPTSFDPDVVLESEVVGGLEEPAGAAEPVAAARESSRRHRPSNTPPSPLCSKGLAVRLRRRRAAAGHLGRIHADGVPGGRGGVQVCGRRGPAPRVARPPQVGSPTPTAVATHASPDATAEVIATGSTHHPLQTWDLSRPSNIVPEFTSRTGMM